MSNTVIAGKPSNTVGEKDSPLVLRGCSIKILWGNKFIDLIKNGKINVDADKILKTTGSVESITSDGIYLVGESVWAVIGGTKIQIAGDSATTYVSYLVALETTPELKKLALTNIGFYYDTYEQAQDAGLTTGIVYVLGDNKLYVVKDEVLTEYITTNNNTSDEETPMEKLYISEYSLIVDGEEYITCDGDINVHKKLVIEKELISKGATNNYGYRLYMLDGKSYLEIDNLICRNSNSEEIKKIFYPKKYFNKENLVINQEIIDEKTIITLLSDEYIFLAGDVLYTSTIKEESLIEIDVIIDEVLENNLYIVTIPENCDIKDCILFYKKSNIAQPVVRIQEYNLDLLDLYLNINTRIGHISEIPIDNINFVYDYTGIDIGIYSNNAVLLHSNILNSYIENPKIRNAEFTNIAKYSNIVTISDNANDERLVTANWVLNKLSSIKEDIESLKDQLSNLGSGNSGDLISITNRVSKLEGIVDTIQEEYVRKDEFEDLLNQYLNIVNGDIYNPIILISGVLTKNIYGLYIFSGSKKEAITSIVTTIQDGLMTVNCYSEKTINITSSQISLYYSGYTNSLNLTNIHKDGVGSHWFETRHSGNLLYIREFHLYNDSNDSWASDTWVADNAVNSINITVFGYITK